MGAVMALIKIILISLLLTLIIYMDAIKDHSFYEGYNVCPNCGVGTFEDCQVCK